MMELAHFAVRSWYVVCGPVPLKQEPPYPFFRVPIACCRWMRWGSLRAALPETEFGEFRRHRLLDGNG